ncbi:MAG: 4-(cytidine 5'-diphospho)-2-C-methyl-D-erythritol kinase [Nitrospirae bacterium]|nr:4-(cytidine 5'-diphospho)-2-C-methyl-D-erythritol kinase [Nitrospirota bacterium]
MAKRAPLVPHPPSLTIKAPAKINWFLNVLGLRDDGFHEIQSLMQKVTLYDVLTFAPSKEVRVKTDAQIPLEENLVYKAAMLLKNTYGVTEGALIQLDKNIPAGAGLGGGSSDAAAALAGLNKLWSLGLSKEELCRTAEKLGSDVPFFLHDPLCVAHGRGEKLTPCKAEQSADILLVKPPVHISTAWAYREFKSRISGPKSQLPSELTKKADKDDNIEFLIRQIERAELEKVAGTVSNDLESVVIKGYPVISEIKERLKEQESVFSMMSGSGSTVFGVFGSAQAAEKASGTFQDCWTAVVQTITD